MKKSLVKQMKKITVFSLHLGFL